MENLCCTREHSVQFLMRFFYTVKLYILTKNMRGPLDLMTPKIWSEYYRILQFTYVSFSIFSYACCSLDIPHSILLLSIVDLRFSVTVRDPSWMLMLNFVVCEEKRK